MKAIILAAGGGTRIYGPNAVLPKCLLPVYDRPLVLYQLEQCALAGATEVLISIASRSEHFLRSVLQSSQLPEGLTVHCVPEEAPLGPVGGLIALQPLVGEGSVLMILGDMYFEQIQGFHRLHLNKDRAGVDVGVIRNSPLDRILCNVVLESDDRVLRIWDKPPRHEVVGDIRWCGVVRFGPGSFAAIPATTTPDLALGNMLDQLRERGAWMVGIDFDEVEININSPESLMLASCVEARRRYATGSSAAPDSGTLDDLVTVASSLRGAVLAPKNSGVRRQNDE